MTLRERFRAYLGSADFVVSATAIVVALAAGAAAFEQLSGGSDGYFVVLLAGIGVPSIYENQWPADHDSRAAAVAWTLGACLVLLTTYVVLTTALTALLDDFVSSAVAFATAWLLGVMGAQRYGDR
ncbi:hypothetical protein [Halobacterium rubrum]|uniref:hypothetical protein n=1 Tax=Halobacterium TaxID=2239 RepID=UPI001F48F054|nr:MULTISPECIES: hypothetical protein [Halobacterium]MDH5020905.1 hypothetical protein [Halobacterium rubrum]